MSFEESLVELEGIVDKLEKGQLSLDESLVLFEKGIKLVRECNTKLKSARQKVEQLIEENGGLRTEPFEVEE
ncbi:MAG: exodeoxyribonuclease VII small subunit [Candidatus Methanoperedenaceae archaeon]|nr:exodeoxyribonuclease VII small subunit [Candidatus Methanoperedenaceae archaeon]